jgi:hypothetical protein
MKELYRPPEIWQQRQDWINEELEKADCAGAWISIIIMSVSVIDAHLREDMWEEKMGTAQLSQC